MITLDNLSNDELEIAVESNFIDILNNTPDRFEEYFKTAYKVNSNRIIDIFSRMVNDGFAETYPNVVFNVFRFILINKGDYYVFLHVPISLYKSNKKEYLDLLKVALNNCTNIFYVKYLLKYVAEKTNDEYFLSVAKLLDDKSKEFIDAQSIFSSIEDIKNLNEIYTNWDKYSNAYYQQSIYNINDIEKQRDILCKKLYNTSFECMKDRYYQYIISNRTDELDRIIIWLERIIKSTKAEEIIQIYNETIQAGNEFKTTYEDIAKQIDNDSKKSISNVSKYKPSEELKIKTINDISIYDISESEFNLIVHNISAGLGHKKIFEESNIDFSIWCDPNTEGGITISTSEISNTFLGHLTRKENEVMFVFSDIPEDEIFFSGTYDIGINTYTKDYSKLSPADGIGQHFLADQLMKNCFIDYNEIVINRFTDKTKSKKRMPNYIICFDKVNELSLKYAEYFNIPVLFIDTKKCAYKSANEIKQKIENTNNSIDLLNNVNEYFSFICGLKYSNVIFDIVNLNNWEEIIIKSIKNVVANAKSKDDLKEILIKISYIEKNIPEYLNGIISKFNNADVDYSEIANKFANFPQKISSIRETIYDKLDQVNVTSLFSDEVVAVKETRSSEIHK